MDRSVTSTRIDWLRSWRGRREALSVLVFAVLCVGVPLFHGELYPFSCAPMFEDAPQKYCDYKILDPRGKEIEGDDLVVFGVQRNYWGNPVGMGTGYCPPPTVDRFGEVPPAEAVTAAVERGLERRPDLDYVDVICEVIGPVDRGIGVTTPPIRWRVTNPRRVNQEKKP